MVSIADAIAAGELLIHVSALACGYANLMTWTPGRTFYVAGLSYAGASCAKASMPPRQSIICTRFSRLRRGWPSSCAWTHNRLSIRRPSPEEFLMFG